MTAQVGVLASAAAPPPCLQTWDLGCGTGLVGAALRRTDPAVACRVGRLVRVQSHDGDAGYT